MDRDPKLGGSLGYSAADLRNLPVLLFYDGYETKAYDWPGGRLASGLRGTARYWYRTAKRVQTYTGFGTAMRNLHRSLQAAGCDVRLNDFAEARRRPTHPIGLTGFPSVLEKVRPGNPAILGPGWVPLAKDVERVCDPANVQLVTQPCDWVCDLYRGVLGDRIQPLFVGIDTDDWPDLSGAPKAVDCLVYDKIRWNIPERRADLLEPLLAMLRARGLSFEVLRYGHHHLGQFRAGLGRSRSLLFLTEHETQGLAYQEAMSSGLPVFAWDEGVFVDPRDRAIVGDAPTSAVPYFDERCGITFRIPEMEERFEAFWSALPTFRPRDYVEETLALRHGAARYLDLYARLLP